MAEYAAYYGGPPSAEMPWPLFLACAIRTARYDARARLSALDSTMAAIGGSFGDRSVEDIRDELEQRAYPVKRRSTRWIANLAAPVGQRLDA